MEKRENIVLKLEVSVRLPKSQKANIYIKSCLTLVTLWTVACQAPLSITF